MKTVAGGPGRSRQPKGQGCRLRRKAWRQMASRYLPEVRFARRPTGWKSVGGQDRCRVVGLQRVWRSRFPFWKVNGAGSPPRHTPLRPAPSMARSTMLEGFAMSIDGTYAFPSTATPNHTRGVDTSCFSHLFIRTHWKLSPRTLMD
jgi:hypothetical protein